MIVAIPAIFFGISSLFSARFRMFNGRIALGKRAQMAGFVILLTNFAILCVGVIAQLFLLLINIPPETINSEMIQNNFALTVLGIMLDYGIANLIAYPAKDWVQNGKRHNFIGKLSLAEAAQYLRMHESDVVAMVADGKLLSKRGSDGKLYFLHDTLLAFKQKQAGSTLTAQPVGAHGEIYNALMKINDEITNAPSANLYFRRATLYLQLEDNYQAAADFERVLALQKYHPEAKNIQRYLDRLQSKQG